MVYDVYLKIHKYVTKVIFPGCSLEWTLDYLEIALKKGGNDFKGSYMLSFQMNLIRNRWLVYLE